MPDRCTLHSEDVLMTRGPRDPSPGNDRIVFTLIVAGFLLYAGLFIYRTSFVVDGERYFSLFDDAMISMRYARNLANGYGLVWNPGGDRIEGYTNPLWVLYMSGIHLLPLAPSQTSLFVQVTAALLLAANLWFVHQIALSISGSTRVSLGAVVLTALYLPINNWSLQGMEVSALVLIMSVCLYRAIRCVDEGVVDVTLYLLLGLSTFIRPDMVVPLGGLTLFLAAADRRNRWRHLIWGLAALVSFSVAQTLFRLWYFGDILPNTYYLKLTGYPVTLRITEGGYALLQFIWKFNVCLFVLPFVLALRGDRRIWLLLWSLIGQLMYSVYVGGDAWEYWGGSNRYISIAMPGFFVLLSYGLFVVGRLLLGVWRADGPHARVASSAAERFVFPALILGAVMSVNSIYGPAALAELLLIKPPLQSGDQGSNHLEVEQALMLRKITTPKATVTVARAGTVPYFSDLPSIDLLGKTDARIARGPARRFETGLRRFIEFRPGHMKFDYPYSIGQLKPDVIFQPWEHLDEVRPEVQKHYRGVRLHGRCVYLRKDSANVLWETLNAEPCELWLGSGATRRHDDE
jgi:hypothetical protein